MRLIFIGKNIKMKIVTDMNKLLSFILLAIVLISNSAYAETIKSSKSVKQFDSNKTMSDDEFMKQFMALDQKVEIKNKKIEELDKTIKTLDEINKLLGVDKK